MQTDGIVGPITWEKLDLADESDPTLQDGSKGVAVRGLQRMLLNRGFDVGEIDGRFGPKTDSSVKTYQRQRGLDVDGIVGPKTWDSLREVDSD